MPEILYPMGYDGSDADQIVDRFVTLQVLEAVHGPAMHPEFRRRLFPLIQESNGLLGIGGGLRANPSNTSEASKKGNSFHQKQLFNSGLFVYQAVDLVGHGPNGPNSHQRAWDFAKINGPKYGIMTAHNWREPEDWHAQCSDLPRSVVEWRAQGSPDPRIWELPNSTNPPVGVFVHATVRKGDVNADVYGLQSVLRSKANQNVIVNGIFGNATDDALRNLQTFWNSLGGNLTVDGIGGPKTWEVVDYLANT